MSNSTSISSLHLHDITFCKAYGKSVHAYQLHCTQQYHIDFIQTHHPLIAAMYHVSHLYETTATNVDNNAPSSINEYHTNINFTHATHTL